ncbi:chromosomal replication initiator protein DnaA [Streptococcus moroccensis]|uniref:Chromosomal replication initiator protein DnaA n=1 Tax=Streptococcus moroccensis TaxID=1451356 RepID=A0ABT9YU18_9STRE|nr:chromosomal replication initiator protein DnaA [Streptococcus moroccensis]MDQ0223486.1 chromosomal replication initiator protein [Streptococcus moroccensis]
MSLEDQFWRRVQELARTLLKQATYDYYVSQAKLLTIVNDTATIQLDLPLKQLFWDTTLQSAIIQAGFEVFEVEMKVAYVFSDANSPSVLEKTATDSRGNNGSQQATITENLVQEYVQEKPGINSKYTFDNFVQGEGNRWAFAAASAVSESPGTAYNPLFIWGGSGLGKTHLLNAIGNKVLSENPRARVKYITTDNFINEYISHIRLNTMDELKEKFRNLDVLLIDDIQSLAQKKSTQEEFFNTFNALYDNKKQIVLTSDRTPSQLDGLEERLVTRFNWGLPVDITPPDFETRVAILNQKIQEYSHLTFKQEAIEYLANHFNSNVRELEGALKNISLVANVKQVDTITVDLAVEALRSRTQAPTTMNVIPIDKIQHEVGQFYGVSVKEIKGTKRVQNIVQARQVAMYLARELTDNSLPKIGKEFGNRDHSTVLHAYNKIKAALAKDDNLTLELQTIRGKIR